MPNSDENKADSDQNQPPQPDPDTNPTNPSADHPSAIVSRQSCRLTESRASHNIGPGSFQGAFSVKKHLITILLTALIASPSLFAQATAVATISGTVTDASGSSVPAAEVRVTATETGIVRRVRSGNSGDYAIPNLPVGPYQLQVSKEGFSTYIQSGIVLQVNASPVIDPILKTGSVSEQIEVTADAAMVETRDASVGQVIDRQRISELPLNGRQATQLVTLSGAAVDTTAGTAAGGSGLVTVRNQPSAVSISVSGSPGNFTSYLLDGGVDNDPLTNVSFPFPFPDALQEFSVQTSALPARYGFHPGGSVNAVTKSGTNSFHGDAFEFLRNGVFNARNFFAARQDTLKRNQFGGTIGGPVLHNKLFFFAGFQGTPNRSAPSASTAFVVTAKELTGDFSDAASAQCNAGRAVTLKGGFDATGKIAPSLLNQAAVKLATLYLPLSTDVCGKLSFGIPQKDDERQIIARGDYQQSQNNSIFLRYFTTGYTNPPFFDGKNALTTTQVGLDDRAQAATLGDTYLFGPNTISSFHVTAARGRVNRSDAENFFTPCDLGVRISCLVPNYSSLGVTGFFNIGGTSPGPFNSNTYQGTEDIDLVRGTHQFSFGASLIRTQLNAHSNIQGSGIFTFSALNTNLGIADFLLGRPASFAQSAEQQIYERSTYIGLYVQDSWKVSHRVTVSYGLRWEPYLQQNNIQGRVAHFSLDAFLKGTKSTIFPNAPAGRSFPGDPGFPGSAASANSLLKFAPRIGIVIDPRGNGKEKISAAYGVFYDHPLIYYMAHFPTDPPWGTSLTLNNPVGGFSDPWLNQPGGNIFPTPNPPPSNVTFPQFGSYDNLPPQVKPTMVQHWNFAVQKQIADNWLLSVNYLGNHTTHLWLAHEINPAVYLPGNCTVAGVTSACSTTGNINQRRLLNRLNPVEGAYYGSVLEVDDGASASYHGLLVSAQHRFSQGFTALTNYTWSHCINDGEETMNIVNGYQDPNNRAANRGNCASDRRHLVNLSVVASSPKFSSKLMRLAASNWQLSPIFTASSGAWLTVTSGVQNSITGAGNDRPNLVGSLAVPAQRFDSWFNPNAFQSNAVGTYGNSGRNTVNGPGRYTLTLALVRRIPVREWLRAEIRAEAFNVMNHANGTSVALSTTSPQFGRVTAAADPRILQFGLKLAF